MAGRKLPKSLTKEQVNDLLEQVKGKSSMALRNRTMLVLMADCGLRLDEVLSLETSDFRREREEVTKLHLTHTKGNWERIVYLMGRARDALARWLERRASLGLHNGLVFGTLSKGVRRIPLREKYGEPRVRKVKRGGKMVEETVQSEGFVPGATEERLLERGKKISPRYVRTLVGRLAAKAGLPEWVTPHTLRHSAAQHLYDNKHDIEVVRKFLGHRNITTTQIYAEASDDDVRRAVEAMEPQPEATDVQELVDALPAETRRALAKLLAGEGEGQ